MPKSNEFKFSNYFKLPNPSLRSYFGRLRAGNSTEYRTTFFKGKSLEKILAMWKVSLEAIGDKWPTLLDFENDLAKKVGPLSIQKPLSERLDDIESYYESILLDSKPLSEKAIAAVLSEWGNHRGLHPKDHRATLKDMKLSTNSGSPLFEKKRDVVRETVPIDIEFINGVTKMDMPIGQYEAAAVLGWRGQEGGPTEDDVKQRVVWMFPFGVNLCELSFYQVAISAAQRYDLVPAWVSMESVDRRITRLFDTKRRNDLIVCTDFTKFDQHFNPDMQSAAYHIINGLMDQSPESEFWLKNVFPIKYAIPLAYDWDKIRTGLHGMGSGSGGTNFDETVVHRALQYEAAQSAGQRLNPNSQCLGDDGLLSYPGITVEDVTRSYARHGQDMNLDKQYASANDCTYLRRWHHTDYRVNGVCVGVYSTYRALGRLCEQERYYDPEIWSKEMVALRQLSILENCKYHPLREDFVKFCMKGDKYKLGLEIPGFLDKIESIAKEATDYMQDFLGYVRSELSQPEGIGTWWITNYLKSLR